MPRKKKERQVWQQRFNLYGDNPDDVRLYAYLQKLAEDGDAAEWIRSVLHNAVPSEYNHDTTVVQGLVPGNEQPVEHRGDPYTRAADKQVGNLKAMTPAERIAANKAAARAKHPMPPNVNGRRK